MSKKVFILEDSHNRMVLFHEIFGFDVVHATTVEEGVRKFEKYGPFNVILLDHDLEDGHYADLSKEIGTGTEFARWLAENKEPAGLVVIHSYNPDGARRMADSLKKWKPFVQPFGLKLLDTLREI